MDFLRTLDYQKLLVGGVIGVIAWWLYTKFSEHLFNIKLSPHGLLRSVFGFKSAMINEVLHLLVAIVLYPLLFLFLKNVLQNNFYFLSEYIDVNNNLQFGLLMGVLAWFLALGVLTPLGGAPFMLKFKPISWSSLLGHIVYAIAVVYGMSSSNQLTF